MNFASTITIVVAVLVALALITPAAVVMAAGDLHLAHGPLSYEDAHNWPGTCQTGAKQSPVDLTAARRDPRAADPALREVAFDGECRFARNDILLKDDLHTVTMQMVPRSSPPSPSSASVVGAASPTCTITDPTATAGGKFNFAQMHVHMSAEHQMDSPRDRVDAELHFVSVRPIAGGGNLFLVVGVFASVVPRAQSPESAQALLLSKILDPSLLEYPFPRDAGGVSRKGIDLSGVQNDLADLFPPAGRREYLTYAGSLTTPRCDENVTWVVFTQPIEIWQETADAFVAFVNESEMRHLGRPFGGNARPLQPLHGRVVRRSMARPPTPSAVNDEYSAWTGIASVVIFFVVFGYVSWAMGGMKS